MNPTAWDREKVLELARGYQAACVLAAAGDLDVFTALSGGPRNAAEVAAAADADPRGMAVLLDALAALGLLAKEGPCYHLAPGVGETLAEGGATSVLGMVRHQANCLRRWTELPWVVKYGGPAVRRPSVRGAAADEAAFIQAMNDLSAPVAGGLVAALKDVRFRVVLDVGGASGSWTIAWLEAHPGTTAILFDLESVIPMASERLAARGLADRVRLVAGDYHRDALPAGADLAWVSAIAHQNSREQNRSLYRRIAEGLPPGGTILIRDLVMAPSRTEPAAGALFAVNMLVATEGGGTYTLDETRADLEAAGFANVEWIHHDPGMHSVLRAIKE
jgi:precorrin-6B methylase 2